MKINIKYPTLILLLIFHFHVLYSQNFYGIDSIKNKPFSFKAAVRMDGFNNFSGGMDQGGGYLGEADIQMKFSTEKAGLWKGGELFVQAMNTHGKKPSANIVGDIQTFSNIEAADHTSFYEIWYNQHLFKDKVSVLFGQLDMNADFSVSENGMYFINSSFGVIPTLSMNNTLSIFPLLTLGGVIKVKPCKRFFIQTGFYNGYSGDFTSNPYAIEWKYKKDYGFYNITEIHYSHVKDTTVTGTYKLGLFFHTGNYTKIKTSDTIRYNYGIYVIADQLIIRQNSSTDRGLNVFLEASFFPGDRNFLSFYFGGGLRYRGFFDNRKEDDMGLALANSFLSKDYINFSPNTTRKNETAIELMYKVQMNQYITLQPEVQYIINPGASVAFKNGLIGLIRVIIKFEN